MAEWESRPERHNPIRRPLTAEARRLCPFSRKVEYSLPSEGSSNHEPQNVEVPGITTEQIVDFSQSLIESVLKAHRK
jgi:hypothetical protein